MHEIEEKLISQLFKNNNFILETDLISEDFQSQKNKQIYKTILELYAKNKMFTPSMLDSVLKIKVKLYDEIAREEFLFYAKEIKKKSIISKVLSAMEEIKTKSKTVKNLDDFLSAASDSFIRIRPQQQKTMLELVTNCMNKLEEKKKALITPFPELDHICPFSPGDLITIAGRPGTGKTSLMLSMAKKMKSMFFSLEMTDEEIFHRLLSQFTGISMYQIKREYGVNDALTKETMEAANEISELPMIIADIPSLKISSLAIALRKEVFLSNIEIAFVDYLQLMRGRGENRESQISFLTRSLKEIAIKLNIPIVIGSQLNRNMEHRQDYTPKLSDLRESGAIEQDSNAVIFIEKTESGNNNLFIAKNRNGKTGKISVNFDAISMTFTNSRT